MDGLRGADDEGHAALHRRGAVEVPQGTRDGGAGVLSMGLMLELMLELDAMGRAPQNVPTMDTPCTCGVAIGTIRVFGSLAIVSRGPGAGASRK